MNHARISEPQRSFGAISRPLFVLAAGLLLAACRTPAPRYPDYALDLSLPLDAGDGAPREPAPVILRAGFGKVAITPEVPEPGWFKKKLWLAGYGLGRVAEGVHDELWARAVVVDDGTTRLALVSLDLIGFFYDEVVQVRKELDPALGVDYLMLASTHTHSGPDTVGVWGGSIFRSGVNPAYQARVREAAKEAVRLAVGGLAEARLRIASVATGTEGLIHDSRPPEVIDDELVALGFESPAGGQLGTVVVWSNHPEVLDDHSLRVTADFPHYLRGALERALGGTAVYFSGSVGGLMTPLDIETPAPDGELLKGNNFQRCEAIGEIVAAKAVQALSGAAPLPAGSLRLRARARTIEIPLENNRFLLGAKLGVIKRGFLGGQRIQTEVGVLELGPLSLLLVPGEIYPEIVVGGVEAPAGADHDGAPYESPPLKAKAPTDYRAVIGLANDEIGYIIPWTQWDVEHPYTYGADLPHYGEINSIGPEAARSIYRGLSALLDEGRAEAGGD